MNKTTAKIGKYFCTKSTYAYCISSSGRNKLHLLSHRERNDITVSSYLAKHSEIGFPPSMKFSICTPIKGTMSGTKRFHVEIKRIKSVKGNRVLGGILR